MALEAQAWASRGGQMLKVMKDFIKCAAGPNLGDLTYSEARQFLSNAAERLSTAEQMKLPPKAARCVSQFASSLNDAICDVAQDASVLDDYSNAVDQYRQAMKLNNLWAREAPHTRPWSFRPARLKKLAKTARTSRQVNL